ncbi:MAG: hypothetical protein ACHQUC_04185, partial [Chlamydiales bacterium]
MVPPVSSEATCHQGSSHHEPNNSEPLPLVASRAMADLVSSSITSDPTKQLCKVTLNPFRETRQRVAVASNFFKLKIDCSCDSESGIRVYLENSQNLFFFKDQLLGGFNRVKIKLSEKVAIQVRDSTLDAALRENTMHGPVKIVGKDGFQWEGEFRNGQLWNGKGKVQISSGNENTAVYEGEWTNGRFIGKITLDSGKIFEGEFSDEVTWKDCEKEKCFLNGRVTHKEDRTNWEGEYRDRKPWNGQGVHKIESLDFRPAMIYFGEGVWRNGSFEGKMWANLLWTVVSDGQEEPVWEGEFRGCKPLNGQGTLLILDREPKCRYRLEDKDLIIIAKGSWSEGNFTGKVTLRSDGLVFEGEFSECSFDHIDFLRGKVSNQDGAIWEGEYRNGQPWNGEGRLINLPNPWDPIPRGEITEEGTWTNGILTGKVTKNSGTTLEGQFWQGYPLIKKTLHHQNGTAWEGLYFGSRSSKKGRPWIGEGKIVVEDWICEGRWIEGQFIGRMVHTSGKVCEGKIQFSLFAKEKEDGLFVLDLLSKNCREDYTFSDYFPVDFNGKIINSDSSTWEGNCYIHIDRKQEKPKESGAELVRGGGGDSWGSANARDGWSGGRNSWGTPRTPTDLDSFGLFQAEESHLDWGSGESGWVEEEPSGGFNDCPVSDLTSKATPANEKVTPANESIRFEPIRGAGRLSFGDWIGEGQWKDGAFAEGQIIMPSGKVFEGEFNYRFAKCEGDNWSSCPIRYLVKGKVIDPDGSTWEGEFRVLVEQEVNPDSPDSREKHRNKDNKLWNGQGRYVYSNCADEGIWLEGCLQGKRVFKNGKILEGKFGVENNLVCGKIINSDGSTWEGEFRTLVKFDNSRGHRYKDNKPWNGQGRYVYSNGADEGIWLEGCLQGKRVFKNGKILEGKFDVENNLVSGKIINSDGST